MFKTEAIDNFIITCESNIIYDTYFSSDIYNIEDAEAATEGVNFKTVITNIKDFIIKQWNRFIAFITKMINKVTGKEKREREFKNLESVYKAEIDALKRIHTEELARKDDIIRDKDREISKKDAGPSDTNKKLEELKVQYDEAKYIIDSYEKIHLKGGKLLETLAQASEQISRDASHIERQISKGNEIDESLIINDRMQSVEAAMSEISKLTAAAKERDDNLYISLFKQYVRDHVAYTGQSLLKCMRDIERNFTNVKDQLIKCLDDVENSPADDSMKKEYVAQINKKISENTKYMSYVSKILSAQFI